MPEGLDRFDGMQDRYATWDEAVAGGQAVILDELREALKHAE